MQKITPHLWFDKEAKEAAAFYTSVFDNSKVVSTTVIKNTPSGDCDIVKFELCDMPFMAISAGPYFKFNPSISFSVFCAEKEEVDALWQKLFEGGKALMDIGSYPWSERYGWLQDRYGLSWQIMLVPVVTQKIVPHLTFTGSVCGKAEEAMHFYASVFKNAKVGNIFRYTRGQEPDKEGDVAHASFTLENQEFSAMDSAREHNFIFNEAVSFIVRCDTQEEIDYYWEKLSAVPQSEQCGWLKDKYGLSWQIVPAVMDAMMETSDRAALDRVTQAFLKMKKFDIAELERAAEGA